MLFYIMAITMEQYLSRERSSAPPTPWCSKLSKREPSGHPRLWSPTTCRSLSAFTGRLWWYENGHGFIKISWAQLDHLCRLKDGQLSSWTTEKVSPSFHVSSVCGTAEHETDIGSRKSSLFVTPLKQACKISYKTQL